MKFKALISVALSAAMCMGSFCVVEADDSALAHANTNYSTYSAEVTYTNPLDYTTRVSVIMTENDVTSPAINDYIRVAEGECAPGETVTITMKLGDDITVDADYKFFIYASGHDAENGNTTATTYIMSTTTVDDKLSIINNASENGISALILSTFGAELGITGEANGEWRDAYIASAKLKDYANKFKSPDDVKMAWILSETLHKISTADTAEVTQIIEAENDAFGLDLANEDYLSDISGVCEIFKNMCETTVGGATEYKESFLEAIAVAMINKKQAVGQTDSEYLLAKNAYLKKYQTELGISNELMTAYENAGYNTVLRQFGDMKFMSTDAIVTKLTQVISAINSANTNNNRPSGGGGGGGGGSSSGGGPSFSGGAAAPVEDNKPMELFNDMDNNHWAIQSVGALKTMGVIDGYTDGSFRPNNNVTREEFVKLIVSAFEIFADGAECAFNDVSENAWFREYVAIASAKEIIKGVDAENFGVGQNIKRQDAAVILDRLLRSLDVQYGAVEPELYFNDAAAVGDYAVDSVKNLVSAGIINGIDGNFKPNEPVSRAQAAKMIYGSMQYRGEGGGAQ